MKAKEQFFFKFTSPKTIDKTTFYVIEVCINDEDEPIIIQERYSELLAIHERCDQKSLPKFPPKKIAWWGNNDPAFIEKRKIQLQNYYNTLAKEYDIRKLPELYKYIMKHRKPKNINQPTSKPMHDGHGNIGDEISKEQQVKKIFQAIVSQTISKMIDISFDFEVGGQGDPPQRYVSELQKIVPPPSQILAPVPVGVDEENDGGFWSVFFMEEHNQLYQKAKNIGEKVYKINEQKQNQHHELAIIL